MQVQHKQSHEEKLQDLQHQVDELKAVNILLQEQLARKEQFTAMIAHELRGPLSPIINYAQMLARQASKGEVTQQKKALQRSTNIIIGQARRLARLVEDLLDASRLTSDQFTLVCASCDLVSLAQDVVEQLRPVAPYHKIVVDVLNTPIIGNWDSGRLQQAIGNLLDNAIKYSDESTTITLRIWTTQDFAHVSVHNEGVSLSQEDIGQLFRPYTRLQATKRTSSGSRRGTGLGLYITKSIIQAHQGELRLEPYATATEESRRGTTFTFDLPLI